MGNTSSIGLANFRCEEFWSRLKRFLARPEFAAKPVRILLLRLWWELRRKLFQTLPPARLDGGVLLRLLPSPACFSLYATGISEREVSEFIGQYLGPGMTFIDVGAYVGEHCVRASRIVGDHGRVYAFEPSPDTFQVLTRNVHSNHLQNVLCQRIALSDGDGEALYERRLYPDGAGLSREAESIHIGKLNPILSRFPVKTRRVDDYVQEQKISAVDLVKLDVEGAELKVLRGSRNTLSRFGPALIFEFDPRLMGTYGFTPLEVVSFLGTLGYRLFLPQTEGPGLSLVPFQFPISDEMHVNLVATRGHHARYESFSRVNGGNTLNMH
jgi:FkbM family methyltransferase